MRMGCDFQRIGPGRTAGFGRGFSLIEIAAAIAILAVLLSASVQMIRAVSAQQRAAERRIVAFQAVQAISEQLVNTPWDQLTTEAAARTAIPQPLAGQLPAAKLSVTVDEQSVPISAKRIRVELTWTGPSGAQAGTVGLTSWAFPES